MLSGLEGLFATVVKTGAVTLISAYSMKALDKKDFANLIKFSGASICGLEIFRYIHLEQLKQASKPPLAERITDKVYEVPFALIKIAMKMMGHEITGGSGGDF